tara:strand:+ start:623 stop:1534 length:912 start_codon:yes stop_codon:yes gene_type:complete
MDMASISMAIINIIKASKNVQDIAPSNIMNDLSVALAAANISSSTSFPPSEATSEETHPEGPAIQAAEPMQTFHPFSRLPTERQYPPSMSTPIRAYKNPSVRLQIWTLALPLAEHLYTVSISIPCSIDPSTSPFLNFTVHHPTTDNPGTSSSLQPSPHKFSTTTSLLLTNHESRSIYLSHNTSFLPISNVGKLYFNPSETTFHVKNYTTLQRSTSLASAFKADVESAQQVTTILEGIKHLATSKASFYPSVERDAWWSGSGGGPSVRSLSPSPFLSLPLPLPFARSLLLFCSGLDRTDEKLHE